MTDKPNWTTTRPTEPGWYWVRLVDAPDDHHSPEPMELWADNWWRSYDDDTLALDEMDGMLVWPVRIEPPKVEP